MTRAPLLRRGVRLNVATLAYDSVVGVVALIAGALAGSIESALGIMLAALSIVVMPLLARGKRRIAL